MEAEPDEDSVAMNQSGLVMTNAVRGLKAGCLLSQPMHHRLSIRLGEVATRGTYTVHVSRDQYCVCKYAAAAGHIASGWHWD